LIEIRKSDSEINERVLSRFVAVARKASGVKGEVNLLLTSNREMRSLNRCFRGIDKATDVISFPAGPVVNAELAGDVAISVEIADSNARRYGHTLQQELQILILHGLLHLAGHDHETDSGEMQRKESRLRVRLGLPDNLIDRAGSENVVRAKVRKRVTRRTAAKASGSR
jgi:probable rRNA maturation factor